MSSVDLGGIEQIQVVDEPESIPILTFEAKIKAVASALVRSGLVPENKQDAACGLLHESFCEHFSLPIKTQM